MVKETELRIGNWVFAPVLHGAPLMPIEIQWIKHGYVGTSLDTDDPKFETKYSIGSLDGIPISEAPLLAFGFNKKENELSEHEWEKFEYEIPWWGSFYIRDGELIPKPYYFADAFSQNLKILFVHQLQNIFSSLTGEELAFKEMGIDQRG